MVPKYRDVLKRLAGPGVALADVTGVWELLPILYKPDSASGGKVRPGFLERRPKE
jgi:hypothetical protein